MAKLLSLTVVFFVIALSLAHSDNDHHWYSGIFRPFLTPATICVGNTTTTTYLPQMLTVINNIQGNATYNAVLQLESPTFVAYIKNPANQALLYSNCPAFVTGVKAANAADRVLECTRKRIAQDIQHRFSQVAHNATGSNGPNVFDSNEHDDHCH